MLARFSAGIARYWWLWIAVWIAVVVGVRQSTPRWDDVTHDGDLAYLPADMPSVRGEQLLEEAFPGGRAKSEVVIVLSRESEPIGARDIPAINAISKRMFNLSGIAALDRAQKAGQQAEAAAARGDEEQVEQFTQQQQRHWKAAEEAFDLALELDEKFPPVLHNRGLLFRRQGQQEDGEFEQQLARELDPQLAEVPDLTVPQAPGAAAILDVWNSNTAVVGSKLISGDGHAHLVILRLATEFMASENIQLLETVEDQLQNVRDDLPEGVQLGLSGSAAVGADMLSSARDSIKNTELYTILLVVGILALVYRSPLLVCVPLASIGVALVVSTGLVAALTQLHEVPGFEFWNFKIFTTTKIFVVVILFGAGTDFCLFLIARYKEELDHGVERVEAVAGAVSGVAEALVASALTTILGLATMFFADFGKFRNSGPAIGLCLFVTLIACLTFSPALLRAFGPALFWPWGLKRKAGDALAGGEGAAKSADARATEGGDHSPMWDMIAALILKRPGLILVVSVLLLAPLAWSGTRVTTTYDLLSELAPSRPSKLGAEIMRRHFSVGESGPIVVLMHKTGADLDSDEASQGLFTLTEALYVPGVASVRSLAEPLGDPPRRLSLASREGRLKATLRAHERSRSLFLVERPPQQGGDVARLELVLQYDPFSIEATRTLQRVEDLLKKLTATSQDSYWAGADFTFAGTTAAIRDLRQVTAADNVRIQILVVLAVLGILLMILQRPFICLYMIASVLFSYYVSIGATEIFFRFLYGSTFAGLDWKVPLFLFVILVAIGQDYNIYLATRVFEEQRRFGLMGGLRRAIERTGGIITSCGVIMAGTFVSMTTGSLRGIVELGFALTLGVLLDTFVVRTILLPAFMALVFRRRAQSPGDSGSQPARTPHAARHAAGTSSPADTVRA